MTFFSKVSQRSVFYEIRNTQRNTRLVSFDIEDIRQDHKQALMTESDEFGIDK